MIRTNQTNARALVVGFEAVACAVGVVGLLGGHYIPGTIVGVATLITVLGTREAAAPVPVAGVPAGLPAPAYAAPVQPMAVPVEPMVPVDILPGR